MSSDRPFDESNVVAPTSYDLIPYPSYAYSQTHPDHLATLATLSGMSSPPVERCRVLELGCGSGGNLIPIAYTLPESHFVGIDLSGNAIAAGLQAVSELGLTNITLKNMDILDVNADFGQFDYIIVHGIYSWVPPEVQDKILEICRTNLVPNGVAYVSYNAYPGWHMYSIIRDIMLYHNRDTKEPEARIKQARAFLEYLTRSVPAEDTPYGFLLRIMHGFLKEMDDGYVQHDFMEDINDPVYFYQFMERAQSHGLRYLANAEFNTPLDLPEEAIETIHSMTDDILEREQYLDFMSNRTFRQNALCHAEVPVRHTLTPDCLDNLLIASRVEPGAADFNVASTDEDEFQEPGGVRLSTAHPLTKAALVHLANVWPRVVPFDSLVAGASAILEAAIGAKLSPGTLAQETHTLATNMLITYSQSADLVAFHTHVSEFVAEVSDRPVASAIARYQARNRLPVTNMYHQQVSTGDVPLRLLEYLDGSRDRSALLDVMMDMASSGIIEVSLDSKPVHDPEQVRPALEEVLDAQLRQMSRIALLVG